MAASGRKPRSVRQIGIDGLDTDPKVELEPTRRTFVLPHSVPLIVDTGRLAGIFRVTERTVQMWRNEGMPRAGRGRWDLAEVFPWVADRIAQRAAPRDGSADEANLRYQRARASLHEIELSREQRRVVALEEHLAVVAELAQAGRAVLDAAPLRYFDDREDQDRARIICDIVARALADAAGGARAQSQRVAARVDPAPGPQREPVGG